MFNARLYHSIFVKEDITTNIVLEEKVDEFDFHANFLVKSLREKLQMVRRCSPGGCIPLKLDGKS